MEELFEGRKCQIETQTQGLGSRSKKTAGDQNSFASGRANISLSP